MLTSPAIDWVADNWAGRTAGEKLVLMFLAMSSEGDGPWSASVTQLEIVEWAALSVRHVNHMVAKLISDGVIKTELLPEGQRGGGWYRYTFG
jgi:hypothetical protein